MARKKASVKIEAVRTMVNRMLAAEGGTVEGRRTLGVFLSTLLMDTGNYKGFNYLEWMNGGCQRYNDALAAGVKEADLPIHPFFGDQTRVEYF